MLEKPINTNVSKSVPHSTSAGLPRRLHVYPKRRMASRLSLPVSSRRQTFQAYTQKGHSHTAVSLFHFFVMLPWSVGALCKNLHIADRDTSVPVVSCSSCCSSRKYIEGRSKTKCIISNSSIGVSFWCDSACCVEYGAGDTIPV